MFDGTLDYDTVNPRCFLCQELTIRSENMIYRTRIGSNEGKVAPFARVTTLPNPVVAECVLLEDVPKLFARLPKL